MAKIVMELSGDEKKLVAAWRKATAAQKKSEEAAKKSGAMQTRVSQQVGEAAKRAGEKGVQASRAQGTALRTLRGQQTQSFGAGAVTQLKNYATGLVGISTGVGMITSALREMEELKNSAMESLSESEMSMGRFAQLANTPKEFAFLTSEARRLRKRGAADSLSGAAELVFAVESGGAMDGVDLIADLFAKSLIEDPEKIATGATTMRTTFGVEEAGSYRDLISKALGASQYSITTAEDLLLAASKSGVSAAAMGMSDEEVLAAEALLASAKGSGEEGGQHLAQFFRRINEEGTFQDMSLVGVLDEIEAITGGMSAEDKKKWWGRAQGQEAGGVLWRARQEGTLQTIIADVKRAQAEDAVGQKLALSQGDPALVAAQELRASEGALEVAKYEDIGVQRSLSQASINREEARWAKEGGATAAWAAKKADTVERAAYSIPGMGGDEAFSKRDRNWVATIYSAHARLLGLGLLIDATGGDEVIGRRGQPPAGNSPDRGDDRNAELETLKVISQSIQHQTTALTRHTPTLGRPDLDR